VTVTARITPEIILAAGNDALSCPVALALAAALPPDRSVWVYLQRIYVDGRPYPTPAEAYRFVLAWDARARGEAVAVEGFEFTLECE
jgi:hypothetical protein